MLGFAQKRKADLVLEKRVGVLRFSERQIEERLKGVETKLFGI